MDPGLHGPGRNKAEGVIFGQGVKSLESGRGLFVDDRLDFTIGDLDFPHGQAEFIAHPDHGGDNDQVSSNRLAGGDDADRRRSRSRREGGGGRGQS